jgi:hypothetical protein
MKTSREQIEALKIKLGMNTLEGTSRKWWLAFEIEKAERPEVVFQLLTELEKRNVTIQEFYLAYVYSEVDNIQTNLDYLDLAIEKVGEKRPLAVADFKDLRN